MESFTGTVAGTGGLVTFKDSSWLMSLVLAHQPHFPDQPATSRVFWGYALHPERIGDFVTKPMSACTGEDLDRKSPRLNSSHYCAPRMPSYACTKKQHTIY